VNFDIGIVAVGLAGKKCFEPPRLDFAPERCDTRLRVGDHGLVLLGLTELDHFNLVREFLLDATHGVECVTKLSALLHQLGRFLRFVPDFRIFSEPIQLGETALGFLEVKAPSSAARPTA
jgi:hypothetical protein